METDLMVKVVFEQDSRSDIVYVSPHPDALYESRIPDNVLLVAILG